MDVVEAPRMIDDYIAEGNIVIVSLDPVASVAGLQDEQATLEASLLPKGRYLAVAETFHGFDLSRHVSEMPLEFSFLSISHVLPDPAFCGVSLTSTAALPGDRPPVIPSPPLPWPECYVHTLRCFYARISRVHVSDSATLLSEEQRMDIARAVIGDQMDTQLPMRDVDGEPVLVPVYDSECEAWENCELQLQQRSAASGRRAKLPSVTESPAGSGCDEAEVEDVPAENGDPESSEHGQRPEPRRAYAHVEVWLDVTSAADFDELDQLMHGLRRLLQIERDSARRRVLSMLADQPRTAQWAQDVAAASDQKHRVSGDGMYADEMTTVPPRLRVKKRRAFLTGVLCAFRSTRKRISTSTGALRDRVCLLSF